MRHLELKRIDPEAVEHAIEKAEHYRLLNDPEQAESICLDVLAVDPDNQRTKRILILALTDQFANKSSSSRVKLAASHAASLEDEYERLYYGAIVHEREARAFLAKSHSGSFAYECFEDAMELFEQAIEKRPKGYDDAILRWNSCLRTVRAHNLEPRGRESELPLE